jgi:hypothetical protein
LPAPRAAACLVHDLLSQNVTRPRSTLLSGGRRPGQTAAENLHAPVGRVRRTGPRLQQAAAPRGGPLAAGRLARGVPGGSPADPLAPRGGPLGPSPDRERPIGSASYTSAGTFGSTAPAAAHWVITPGDNFEIQPLVPPPVWSTIYYRKRLLLLAAHAGHVRAHGIFYRTRKAQSVRHLCLVF